MVVFLKFVFKRKHRATVDAGKEAAAAVSVAHASTKLPRMELYQRLFIHVLHRLPCCWVDTDLLKGIKGIKLR